MRVHCLLVLLGLAVLMTAAAAQQRVRVQEYLGRTWTDELISFPLDPALRRARSLAVTDAAGAPVPYQRAGHRIYFLVTLPADGELVYTIRPGRATPAERRVRVTDAGGMLTLDSGVMALRLPDGGARYRPSADPATVPGPLQGVRLGAGGWIGTSWLQAPMPVTGYAATLTAAGPLFADAAVEYAFAGGKRYRFSVRVIAGQPTAIIDEQMDVNPGGAYALLRPADDVDRAQWEWWWIDEADRRHPASAVFSFYAGLEPNQCRWSGARATQPRKGMTAAGAIFTGSEEGGELAYAPLTYERDEVFNRIAGWWVNSFGDRANDFLIYNDRRPETPVISFSRGRPSRTVNPLLVPPPNPHFRLTTSINDLRIWTRPAKDLQVVAPICLGSRQWLLSVEPQRTLSPPGTKARTSAFTAMLKYAYFPLDKVKDWTLEWPEPARAWPRLFCPPGELAAMRARVAACGLKPGAHGVPLAYFPGQAPEAMAKQALEMLERCKTNLLTGTGFGSINWFHAGMAIYTALPMWEAAMGMPGLDPTARGRVKAIGAFLIHHAWEEDFWPRKEHGEGWGSATMPTVPALARAMGACVLAGHPRQREWLARAVPYYQGSRAFCFNADGSSVSCPHYMGTGEARTLYMALALQQAGVITPFRDDPALKAYGRFVLDMLTPPDPRSPLGGPVMGLPMAARPDPAARNRRNLPPIGDTSRTQTCPLLNPLAVAYAGLDEELAGMLRTAIDEQGGNTDGLLPAWLFVNTTSPTRPIARRSVLYPDYAAFLHGGAPGAESYLAYRQTKTTFQHFHSDQGSFTWFAKGVPLMLDFGSMYSPRTAQAIYHNRIAWDVREGEPRPCPGSGQGGCFYQGMTWFEHTHEPWTAKAESFTDRMAVADAQGTVIAHAFLPGADFLCGQSDVRALETEAYFKDSAVGQADDPTQQRKVEPVAPFSWQRRLLFVKAPVEFLLVRDDFLGHCPPPTASFWMLASALRVEGNHARAAGLFGVDLDLYVAQPAQARIGQWYYEHKNWGGERQVCARVTQPEGKPFLTLLYPRRTGEPAPAFATMAGGNGVKITRPDATAYAFLAPAPVTAAEGGITIRGTAGMLQVAGGDVCAVLSAGGTLALADMTIVTDGPAEARRTGARWTLQTAGAQTVQIQQGARRRAMLLNGRPVTAGQLKLDQRNHTLTFDE